MVTDCIPVELTTEIDRSDGDLGAPGAPSVGPRIFLGVEDLLQPLSPSERAVNSIVRGYLMLLIRL